MPKLPLSAATLVCLSFLAGSVSAEIVIPPTGLNDGDEYRLFFMTSGKRDATSTDIEDYNAFVQLHADNSPELAALGVSWKAVVSTPTVAARDTTGNSEVDREGAPVYLVNGTLMASTNVRLWVDHGGELLNVNELGDVVPFANPLRPENIEAWSGSLQSGAISPFPLGIDEPILGAATLGGSLAYFNRTDDSTVSHHLYAMSPVLTVPEPAFNAFWLLFVLSLRRLIQKST